MLAVPLVALAAIVIASTFVRFCHCFIILSTTAVVIAAFVIAAAATPAAATATTTTATSATPTAATPAASSYY